MKKILKLNPTETSIIINLYKSVGYTCVLDSTQPVVQVLCYKNLIHSGGTQVVTVELDNSIPMKYMLQPYVIETLDHYKIKLKNKIKGLENKLLKTKKRAVVDKLTKELNEFTDIYKNMFGG